MRLARPSDQFRLALDEFLPCPATRPTVNGIPSNRKEFELETLRVRPSTATSFFYARARSGFTETN